MKLRLASLAGGLMAIALFVNTGCEWTGGGGTDGVNTSQGAGADVNFTGVYHGHLAGGKVVQKTSKGNITQLVIHHSGNTLEITDNQGSHYTGTIGAPGVVAPPGATSLGAGTAAVEAQINFSGKDAVAQKDIDFAGVIHLVAVQDVKGNTDASSKTDTTDTENKDVKTTSVTDNTNTTITTVTTVGSEGDPFFFQTTEIVTIENNTGREISRSKTQTGHDTRTQTQSTTFSLTEANSQFRLEGTWIEKAGLVSSVDALSPGNGIIVTQTAAPTGPTPVAQITLF